jgi:hypothetical protein
MNANPVLKPKLATPALVLVSVAIMICLVCLVAYRWSEPGRRNWVSAGWEHCIPSRCRLYWRNLAGPGAPAPFLDGGRERTVEELR